MEKIEAKADYLFEVSWEVCNKVGGIYTVVRSKAGYVNEYYRKDNYFLVGPYFVERATGEFVEKVPPLSLKRAFETIKKEGIICHYGAWLIDSTPNVILVDFEAYAGRKNNIKKSYWDNFRIDSLNTAYFDYDMPVIWATAVGRLLEEVRNVVQGKIVAQFHEWLSGAALLYLKSVNCSIATVFTTHATILGRTMASANADLYNMWDKIDPNAEAYKYNIQAKYQTERQSAINADIFTTVSEITGIEAEHFLKRKPDVLLLNGLNIETFPTMEDVSVKHLLFKTKMMDFLVYYFFPYYSFDLSETLIFFLCGRYEFKDKGIDIFINALGRLNKKLKDEKSKKTVVAFIFVPGNIRAIKPELLENKTKYRDIEDTIWDDIEDIKHKIIYSIASNKKIQESLLFDREEMDDIKRKILRFIRKNGNPPLSTHDLYDEDKDQILSTLKANGLNNDRSDRVKIVYYSIYLTGADGLLDTNYYESMLGSQLGVFPSYYEPWGYTPLEAGALGVSAITTDLAGFGRYIAKQIKNEKNPGMFVLERLNKSDEEATKKLAEMLYSYTKFSKEERVKNKIEAKRLASLADWQNFIKNYIEAHNLAMERKYKTQ